MRISWRVIAIAIVLALLGAFVFENWAAFNAPAAEPGLTFFSYAFPDAPLGMVMLGILGAVTVIFALAMAGMRTSALLEFRRYARETDAARKLADEAEVSRILQLQNSVATEFAALRQSVADEIARAREEAEAQHNMLVANLGQIDDRLDRIEGRGGMVAGDGSTMGGGSTAGGGLAAGGESMSVGEIDAGAEDGASGG